MVFGPLAVRVRTVRNNEGVSDVFIQHCSTQYYSLSKRIVSSICSSGRRAFVMCSFPASEPVILLQGTSNIAEPKKKIEQLVMWNFASGANITVALCHSTLSVPGNKQ